SPRVWDSAQHHLPAKALEARPPWRPISGATGESEMRMRRGLLPTSPRKPVLLSSLGSDLLLARFADDHLNYQTELVFRCYFSLLNSGLKTMLAPTRTSSPANSGTFMPKKLP